MDGDVREDVAKEPAQVVETLTLKPTLVSSSSFEKMVTEYSIQQAYSGSGGGQILDCKVERDEETGRPRVEMIFSLTPVQDGMQNPLLQLMTQDEPLVSATATAAAAATSGCSSLGSPPPADLLLPCPPRPTIFRPGSPSGGSPTRSNVDSAETTRQHIAVSRTSTTGNNGAKDELTSLKEYFKERSDLRRMILCVESMVDWKSDLDPFIIIVIISVLFLLFHFANVPLLTKIAVVGFLVHLFEFIRILPYVDDYVTRLANMNDDDEQRLESTYRRILKLKKRLVAIGADLNCFRRDRPAAFAMVCLSAFYLLYSLGEIVDEFILLYVTATVAALLPGLMQRALNRKTPSVRPHND